MVHYTRNPDNNAKACKAKGSNLRVSYKNTYETATTIKQMTLQRAQRFLRNVVKKRECVPFHRYNGGIGRCAQAKSWRASQGRWPKKSAHFLLDLLKNAESNAIFKVTNTTIIYIQLRTRARLPGSNEEKTHRAHLSLIVQSDK